MGKYMRSLKEKIWLQWFPYISYQYPKDFKSADALLEFKISKEGDVLDVKILDNKGSPLFAVFCAEAVRRVVNFGALPEEYLGVSGKNELEVKFAFHFW